MKNSEKGSATVEGIIVISVVILCIVAIIYIIILMYQLVRLQSTALKSAVSEAVMMDREKNYTPSLGEVSNHIIYKSMDIEMKKTQEFEAGGLLHAFGLSKTSILTSNVRTTINSPAEFIRNTDFLIDTTIDIKQKIDSKKAEKTDKGNQETDTALNDVIDEKVHKQDEKITKLLGK